jgi:hypothetical protein
VFRSSYLIVTFLLVRSSDLIADIIYSVTDLGSWEFSPPPTTSTKPSPKEDFHE